MTTPLDAQVTAATKALCDLAETNHLHGFCKRDWPSNGDCNCEKIASTVLTAAAQAGEEKYRDALEQIALLDEADGHELNRGHAFQAVAIATSTLGKHPSQICAERAAAQAGEEHKMNRAVGAAIQAAFPGPAPAPLGRADDWFTRFRRYLDASLGKSGHGE